MTLRNVSSENTPGTHCVFRYAFQISSPSDPYSTLNLKNLRSNNEISSYMALHYEVDILSNEQIVHLIFSSRRAAESVADQFGTIAVSRCFDYLQPEVYDFSRYNNPSFQETYVFSNAIERELCRSGTQLIPSNFTYVPCETVEVRGYSYASGENKKIHFGIPIGDQLTEEGRWRITEFLSLGKSLEYDVYFSGDNNRVEYTLQYDGREYTVFGEKCHTVITNDSVTINNVLNNYDSQGIMKIICDDETLTLPIAEIINVSLVSGTFDVLFIDRLGNVVALRLDIDSNVLPKLVPTEESIIPKTSDNPQNQSWRYTTFIMGGLVTGIGCCCSSVIYIQKIRRKSRK